MLKIVDHTISPELEGSKAVLSNFDFFNEHFILSRRLFRSKLRGVGCPDLLLLIRPAISLNTKWKYKSCYWRHPRTNIFVAFGSWRVIAQLPCLDVLVHPQWRQYSWLRRVGTASPASVDAAARWVAKQALHVASPSPRPQADVVASGTSSILGLRLSKQEPGAACRSNGDHCWNFLRSMWALAVTGCWQG